MSHGDYRKVRAGSDRSIQIVYIAVWKGILGGAKTVVSENLKFRLKSGEPELADTEYNQEKCINKSNLPSEWKQYFSQVGEKHENVNERIKKFNSVIEMFCHNMQLNRVLFHRYGNLQSLSIITAVSYCPNHWYLGSSIFNLFYKIFSLS